MKMNIYLTGVQLQLDAGGAWVTRSGTAEEIELAGKCSRQLSKGDLLRIETPGGGGWG